MRILLAEDDVALNRALVTILKHDNYVVDAVFDGEDAEYSLLSGLYDLAVLDVMMPKKSGFEVLKSVRDKGIAVPVVMLTALSELDDKVAGLDLGADDYITKPFETREFLARVRAAMRRGAGECKDVLEFGDVTLDRETFELCSRGNKLRLSNKEYRIMEILMSARGVISPERIVDKAWEYDSDAGTNAVWVYVSGLRKKLASLGSNVAIKSSRNAGYYLEIDGKA